MDLTGLRDRALVECGRLGLSVGELYRRVAAHPRRQSPGSPAVSRAQFYRWFGAERAVPDSRLLLLVPGLADVFGIAEGHLLAVAGFRDLAEAHGVELQREVRVLRENLANLTRVLNQSSFTDQSEALVVDRILRSRLDYEIGVWPVVRGAAFPMQLRSWISLRRIPTRSLRPATMAVERLKAGARRDHLRKEVITEELWQHLGLRWRVDRPVEWPAKEDSPLRIELPIDERNQRATSTAFDCHFPLASRVLVMSGLWGHAETFAALFAAALNWRSIDLRYMGFRDEEAEARELVRSELQADTPHLVWSIAQRAQFFQSVSAGAASVPEQPIVLITYGPALTAHAAEAFRHATPTTVEESQHAARALARSLNRRMPVIHVQLSDHDLTTGTSAASAHVSVDLVVDHIRYAVIETLRLMENRLGGPRPQLWQRRRRFSDARSVLADRRSSTVTWNAPGQLADGRP